MKTHCLSIFLLVGCLSARAQSYSIPWSKIAGGGGTSTGGIYAVRGASGQPDAGGPLTNGQYSVCGGFWPAFQLLQTPGAPLLRAELLAGGATRIFWPRSDAGYVLDQATALATPSVNTLWSQAPFSYQTNATHISVTVFPVGIQFYRLRRP